MGGESVGSRRCGGRCVRTRSRSIGLSTGPPSMIESATIARILRCLGLAKTSPARGPPDREHFAPERQGPSGPRRRRARRRAVGPAWRHEPRRLSVGVLRRRVERARNARVRRARRGEMMRRRPEDRSSPLPRRQRSPQSSWFLVPGSVMAPFPRASRSSMPPCVKGSMRESSNIQRRLDGVAPHHFDVVNGDVSGYGA